MAKKIFFNHVPILSKQYKKMILSTISSVIESDEYFAGRQNKNLVKKLLRYFKIGFIVPTASGHDSLYLALLSLKLKPDDEVIIPVNAYPTAFPVVPTLAKMVLVDIDENGQMNPVDLKIKITKKTKAIIIVYMYGLVGNLSEISHIAKRKRIVLIEDCAQAFGTRYKKRLVGTFGDISCFSFYPTKNIGSLGDGGFLWTKHKRLYGFFLKAKSYGEKKRYKSEFPSFHSRLSEMQAGVVNIYLKTLTSNFTSRKKMALYYKKKLQAENLLKYCFPLESNPLSEPIQHLFVCKVKHRKQLQKFFKKRKVPTMIHYPNPIHLVPAFKYLGHKKGNFPVAEKLAKEILSFPFHQFLQEADIDYIIYAIKKFYYG